MEKVIYAVIEFISGILAFLFITVSFLGISDYSFDNTMLTTYKQNWNLGPITDMVTTPHGNECPTGYDKLISNIFPGNNEGCDCTESDTLAYQGIIFTEKCNSDQKEDKCVDVPSQGNITLNTWRGLNICVKRMERSFYDLLPLTTNNTACPSNMKNCGVFDSENNLLCLRTTEQCPINYVEFASTPSINDVSVKSLTLNNGYNLYYSNDKPQGRILVQVKANTHNMCYEPNQGAFGQNHYPLNTLQGDQQCKIKHKGIQSKYDTRFSEIDKELLYDFYNNNLIAQQLAVLTDYPLPTDINNAYVSLYGTNYFGWDQRCVRYANDLFKEDNILEPHTHGNFQLIYVIGIISFMYLLYVLGSFALFCMIDESSHKTILFLVIDVIKALILLSIFIMSVVSSVKNDEILKPAKEFVRMKCGDAITKHALKMSYRYLIKIDPLLAVVAFFSLFDIVLRVGYYVFYFCIRKNK